MTVASETSPCRRSAGPAWGEPPWRLPTDASSPPPQRCDVVVIGAGFTGLSAAYHLARRGAHVAVLEAGHIGAGASGRSGGLALEATAAGPMDGVEHCLDTLAAVSEEAGIACDLELAGCWEVHHAARGVPGGPGWHDGETSIVIAGTEPGGTVHPGRLVAGLADAARRAGATVHCGWPVAAIRATTGGGVAVRGPAADRVEADWAVLAVNAYTGQLLDLPLRFRASLTLALCTARLAPRVLDALGWAERKPFYTTDLPYLWGRHLRGERLIFGAGLVAPDGGDVRTTDLGQPDAIATMNRLESRVRALHPILANVEITHRWGGPIAFRPGGAPILSGVPWAGRLIVAGAYAGHGVALSVRVGQLIAAAVVDGTPLPAWGALPDRTR